MKNLTNELLNDLANTKGDNCISILIPTSRVNNKNGYEKDKLSLKNELKNISNDLQDKKVDEKEIDKKLAPFYDMLEDEDFWSHQSEGLALYQTNDQFYKFKLPTSFQAVSFVGEYFYIKPLISYINEKKNKPK